MKTDSQLQSDVIAGGAWEPWIHSNVGTYLKMREAERAATGVSGAKAIAAEIHVRRPGRPQQDSSRAAKGCGMASLRMAARRVSQVLLCTSALVLWTVKADDAVAGGSAQLRRGEEVAQLKCSACHRIAAKQKYPPLLEDPAPSFQSIANRPQVSERALRHFVATTHWDPQTAPNAMPNPGLSKPDIAAVIRYLLSLKG